jgi:plastocyanin
VQAHEAWTAAAAAPCGAAFALTVWLGTTAPAHLVLADGAAVEVTLRMHAFHPSPILAHPGDQIVFKNEDGDLHSVVLPDQEDVLPEHFIEPATSFLFQVPADMQPGAYSIACSIHVDMHTRLVVVRP